jgi:hypothetical protein
VAELIPRHARTLKRGENFLAGVVIYAGAETRPLTEKIWAVPVAALWRAGNPVVTTILTPGSAAVQAQRRAHR